MITYLYYMPGWKSLPYPDVEEEEEDVPAPVKAKPIPLAEPGALSPRKSNSGDRNNRKITPLGVVEGEGMTPSQRKKYGMTA